MTRTTALRANVDLFAGMLLLAVSGVAFWGARGAGPSVWLFPQMAAAVVGLCGVLLVVEGARKAQPVVVWQGVAELRDVAAFVASAVLYVATLRWFGFWLVSGVFLGGAAYSLGPARGWRLIPWLLAGLVLSVAMDALFVGVFGVPLPGGRLWDDARWRPWVP